MKYVRDFFYNIWKPMNIVNSCGFTF